LRNALCFCRPRHQLCRSRCATLQGCRMIRTLNVVLVVTSIAALVGVYALKYSVEETASEKTAIQRHIERQQGDLSLLKADWAFLNQPANVAPIVTRHVAELNLQPLAQEQFGRFEALPMRMKA